MKSRPLMRRFALAAILLVAATPAFAQERWIGAWGYPALPPAPGVSAPLYEPASLSPLDAARAPAPDLPPAYPLLIDNPGQVPVVTRPDSDPVNVTIRQLVRVAVAGGRLRLRFTNEGGALPLRLGAVRIGAAGADGRMLPGSDHAVTFDGHSGVLIPAGAPLLSDPIDMPVTALEKLAISIHVPGALARGGHALFQYVAGGDQTATEQLSGQTLMAITSLVSEVEVESKTVDSVVVTLGDSITQGSLSTANAFRGWPDRLAERLAAAHSSWSVVNAGIGGNRLLRTGTGPDALARLDRDVFAVPGVKAIILLEGINDIGRGFSTVGAREYVSAEALEAADRQIVERAHEHGIRVIGATLTPYQGAGYASAEGEQVREALNSWILTGGAFDGVVDFSRAVADPANPLTFRAGFNDHDHLHPNDAGYQAMADAIDLNLLTGR